MPNNDSNITRSDLDKTFAVHEKAIQLQILISQQQEQQLDKLGEILGALQQIEKHFTNGFRSELKDHIEEQVGKVEKKVNIMEGALIKIKEAQWKQSWLWGAIAIFTLTSAIALVIDFII